MKCSNCGHLNLDAARFCSSCGASSGPAGSNTNLDSNLDSGEATLSIEVVEPVESPSNISITPPALICVVRGPNAGSKYSLTVGSLEVGRHPASDIFLDDITVSRRHCVFECVKVGDGAKNVFSFSVNDVGSLNGTYVNRKLITNSTLSNGDEIQIGRYVVVIEINS